MMDLPPSRASACEGRGRPTISRHVCVTHAKKGTTMIPSPTMQKAIKAHEDFVASHPEQFRLSLALFRLLAEWKPVSPEDLAASLQRSLQEVHTLLPSADIRVDQEGNILGHGLALLPPSPQLHPRS